MKATRNALILAFLILILPPPVHILAASRSETNLLIELDRLVSHRHDYIDIKETRIAHLKELLGVTDTPEQRFNINSLIITEYRTYQLDSVVVYLNRNVAIAHALHDHERETGALLQLIDVYASSGYYIEADELINAIDTVGMTSSLKREYYKAAYSYNREMREYSIDSEAKMECFRLENYYIDRLIDTSEPRSSEQLQYLCNKYGNMNDWDSANGIIDTLLTILPPDSHPYAMIAYYKALSTGHGRGTEQDYIGYLARSAMADIKTGTRDHASLCLLSQILFYMGDVDRAFRFIQVSMDDAIFFNSRLRPWQVAGTMPIIEKGYQAKIHNQLATVVFLIVVVSILLIVVLIFLFLTRKQNKSIRHNREHLEEMNLQLNSYVRRLSDQNLQQQRLTEEISEANAVKEQYIGLFLVVCSDYIDRLKEYQKNVRKKLNMGSAAALQKELASSTVIPDAIDEFYATFDNAFLGLYPTFVKDFNALLCDDQHIVLKNERQLNTELRIFALIRLGITDSSRIASLLRYSVNTIYNYRAAVKNKAKVSREDFEEKIKKISSFRNE